MDFPLRVQGRSLEADDLCWLRSLLDSHPDWNRSKLSVHIARTWNWRNSAGQLKDIAARSLLRRLEARGFIELPPRQRGAPHSRNAARCIEPVLHSTEPVTAPLSALRPLQLEVVDDGLSRDLFGYLLHSYHYLSYSRPVGENLALLVRDRSQRPLSCVLFGAAAWKLAARDRYIGWDEQTRRERLALVANNMRFLILPWVRVEHLASHILGLAARHLSAWWQQKYGHPIHLLESFVECARFRGTSYRAANWIKLGRTTGRSRNDRCHSLQVAPKDIYCYPVHRRFRQLLSEPPARNPRFQGQ